MGKWYLHASSFIFDQIVIKVAGNQDRHKSSDEFDFGPLVSMAHLYVFWNEIWPWHIGLRWAIVALWATCWLDLSSSVRTAKALARLRRCHTFMSWLRRIFLQGNVQNWRWSIIWDVMFQDLSGSSLFVYLFFFHCYHINKPLVFLYHSLSFRIQYRTLSPQWRACTTGLV